jgi:hypothetical protein
VVFGAAIPFLTGPGHINEQWPSYWAKKFSENGFACFDVIRPGLWKLKGNSVWYTPANTDRQHALLYVRKNTDEYEKFVKRYSEANLDYIDFVHPSLYEKRSRLYLVYMCKHPLATINYIADQVIHRER